MNHPTNPILDPKPSRNRWIIGAAIVGGLLFIGANSTDTATPAPDPKPPVTHTAPAPKVTKPKPKPAPAPTQAEQVTGWYADGVEADLDAFATHNGEMAELFADPYAVMADSTDAEALLGTLIEDVDTLKGHGPIPNPAINRPWQEALDAYADGYQLALDGVRTMDVGTLTAATDKITEGSEHISDATDAIGTVTI